jgi:hypothetical protein
MWRDDLWSTNSFFSDPHIDERDEVGIPQRLSKEDWDAASFGSSTSWR